MQISQDYLIIFGGILITAMLLARAFSKPKGQWRSRRQGSWRPKIVPSKHESQSNPFALGDSVDQLRIVSNASFQPQRLLSRAEARVFKAAEKAIDEFNLPWRVMAQVCLGEILKSADMMAYRSINSKRVDILIISEDHLPIAAIEYQGTGHYLSDAAARDAVKKEALRRAGIGYIEIAFGDESNEVKNQISRLMARRKAIDPALQTNSN
jgi:hypothetical protein